MCTLTYLPTKGGYTLTHNRDERNNRPATDNFRKKESENQTIYFPQDLEANGSWIAFSDKNMAVCLMNGGSKTYERKPEYRHSRGLVVLDIFDYESVPAFYRKYLFDDLEPFTMVVRNTEGMWQITHDEDETTIKDLDHTEPQIWSSTTLYTAEVKAKRRQWFTNWLKNKPDLSPAGILKFHKSAGEGDTENDLIMSRWGILQTLSITQIAVRENTASLVYENFMRNTEDRLSVFISAS